MKKFLALATVLAFLVVTPFTAMSASFNINDVAIGGGLSADGALIPGGAAGGIGAAGGFSAGEASGGTVWFGSAGANIDLTAGGVTDTNAYTFNPGAFGIGVGSRTDNSAGARGDLDGNAFGLASSAGVVGGITGQGSLNGSIVGPSPLPVWNSNGVTFGVAGQGSAGAFVGAGAAALMGTYDLGGGVRADGWSASESYRGIDFIPGGQTEYMGTRVGAGTELQSYGYATPGVFGIAVVDGGWIAGGGAASRTIQTTAGGAASASAVGVYAGAGGLNDNYSGSAVGYTRTSATTYNGYNGSIMSASSGMQVSSF